MPKSDTQFKKGEGGRPPGVQNKLTRTVKDTVLSVFNDIQSDPKNNLKSFAKTYPRDFYQIAAKLIPTEIHAKVNKIQLEIVRSNSTRTKNASSSAAESV